MFCIVHHNMGRWVWNVYLYRKIIRNLYYTEFLYGRFFINSLCIVAIRIYLVTCNVILILIIALLSVYI